ncbi:PepSY-associated TM helix domain-containing protein [Leucothrix arctica]|uniref:PepSY domain-containing protein n=1 Tax=Leucothrix arctica TaxID=1481894 RepID=A0A317C4K2_9GAMM|nr:PepSY-associated TM helix domain-containing protein [Leucothrix arctica]PWQ93508.1 hypothetical protein DKT75_17970 [Leucothrix arctica]
MKILKLIHRWLGLILCLTLLSMSLSGTLLIWKKEYLWLSMQQARAPLQADTASLALAIDKISSHYAANELLLIQIHHEGLALHKVVLDQSKRALYSQHGELIEQWSDNGRVEDWLLDLHHRFLLGNTIGLNIAGFSGLFLVLAMAIGLIIWWPRRRALKLGIFPSKLRGIRKGELIRSHSNLGFMSFIPILLICTTGTFLTYPDQSKELLVEPYISEGDYLLSDGPLDTLTGKEFISWSQVVTRALSQHPNATVRWVSPESETSPYRIIGLQQANGWNSSGQTTVYIDARSGGMELNMDDTKRPSIERLYDFAYPLHTAKLGLWYRILLTIFGFSLFTLGLLGLMSYVKKR